MRRCFHTLPVLLLSLYSCTKVPPGGNQSGGDPEVPVRRALTIPEKVYSFKGEHYAYCPSVVIDGQQTHIFFCANPDSGLFVDNIFHLALNGGQGAKSVLQPGLDWDSRHVCDPCVVNGKFKMEGTTYKYALFFLSNPQEYYYNEIGVAFSNDLSADSWTKYPTQIVKKPWATEGDLFYSTTGKCWGVGQPSALSLDGEGKVLLTYTCGDLTGTAVMQAELDLSDMSSPVLSTAHKMVTAGLQNLNGRQDYACGCDFALCRNADTILMVRPVNPNPADYPSYICSALELDMMSFSSFRERTGTWEKVARIDPLLSGFPRNHNACIARDTCGYVEDWKTPEIYFTVSKASPQVEASEHRHAEWTYSIYRTKMAEAR